MTLTLARTLACSFFLCFAACPSLFAQCPVDSLVIKGRVENAPRNASIRVVLMYPPDRHAKHPPGLDVGDKEQPGESAEAILDGDTFTIPIEFLTNDRRTVMTADPRCGRKPRTVLVTLKRSDKSGSSDTDQDYGHVSLDFAQDFKSDDSRHYMLRSDLILTYEQP